MKETDGLIISWTLVLFSGPKAKAKGSGEKRPLIKSTLSQGKRVAVSDKSRGWLSRSYNKIQLKQNVWGLFCFLVTRAVPERLGRYCAVPVGRFPSQETQGDGTV